MRMRALAMALTVLLTVSMALPVAAATVPPSASPKLIVALAVDQLSADLFAAYRGRFTGGFERLAEGAVFPSGFQGHASTETCPGHATTLTGARPARSGIIANAWSDPRLKRDEKTVYCVEDENASGPGQIISPVHLRVPTLGDRLKAVNAATRVVAVSGKDRSAVVMAGKKPDEIWWYSRGQFVSYAGVKTPAAVIAANAHLTKTVDSPRAPFALPDVCRPYDVAVQIEPMREVGQNRLGRAAKEPARFQASPDADEAVVALALGLVNDMKLGQGPAPDILALGLSATDYVGHTYGTRGAEMCIQLLAVDQMVGKLLAGLDAANIDYVVAFTADHGGQDVPERNRGHGAPDSHRVDGTLPAATVGAEIGKQMKLPGPVLYGEPYGVGDFWIDTKLTDAQRAEVLKRALAFYRSHPDVYAALSREEILATPMPKSPPDEWSVIERVRASYDPQRSGDFYVVIKPRISAYEISSRPYTAGHGTPWDYDRRVPIIFWRKGMTGFEQPFAVETVDIMPTLVAMIGLKVPPGEVDGRCLFGC